MNAVLIVEDNLNLQEALCTTVRTAGHTAYGVNDGAAALATLQEREFDLVVSDLQMEPVDGLALLDAIKRSRPGTPVVLMTAYGDIDRAVTAMRNGASDFLTKPFDADTLLDRIGRYSATTGAPAEAGLVAGDPAMRRMLELAGRVASTSATVLITGASGSGKEVVARYVHRRSPRARAAFIAINCAAIPEQLLEATLFGFEKGAFTGAAQAQPGKFEQAEGGTLLLDEISEMPPALQAKLLRVLQEREVERVGGRGPIALDIRVLATSNRDLAAEVAKGAFREDLYYRLNVFPLHVPALRERPRDILPLARLFLSQAASETGRCRAALGAAAEAILQHHDWPGNVRELQNTMQRALILAPGALIEPQHLNLAPPDASRTGNHVHETTRCAQPLALHAARTAPADIKSVERAHILDTLAAVNGSRKLAIEQLGISERTLRYKLQRYRLAGATDQGV